MEKNRILKGNPQLSRMSKVLIFIVIIIAFTITPLIVIYSPKIIVPIIDNYFKTNITEYIDIIISLTAGYYALTWLPHIFDKFRRGQGVRPLNCAKLNTVWRALCHSSPKHTPSSFLTCSF